VGMTSPGIEVDGFGGRLWNGFALQAEMVTE
jgi:hypothetical protein